MKLVCLDLEGVLVPEIWIAVAHGTGIKELELTTRDVPDYDELMRHRLAILSEHSIGLDYIQSVIAGMEPLEGAKEFLDGLRARGQVLILSDTYEQFADPLMRALGRPTLFCNSLVVEGDGRIVDYRLRIPDGKRVTVEALSSVGLEIAAVGDSYNDLAMIDRADFGVLFRPPDGIREERPDLPITHTYGDLAAELTRWTTST